MKLKDILIDELVQYIKLVNQWSPCDQGELTRKEWINKIDYLLFLADSEELKNKTNYQSLTITKAKELVNKYQDLPF